MVSPRLVEIVDVDSKWWTSVGSWWWASVDQVCLGLCGLVIWIGGFSGGVSFCGLVVLIM